MVKNLPAMQETQVQSLGWDDPGEEEMATHPSILAWKVHGQRSLAGYRPWGRRVGHNSTAQQHTVGDPIKPALHGDHHSGFGRVREVGRKRDGHFPGPRCAG